jgi:hypothetical protein
MGWAVCTFWANFSQTHPATLFLHDNALLRLKVFPRTTQQLQ